MIAPDLIYLIVSIFVFISLSLFLVILSLQKVAIKKDLMRPIAFAIISIPSYCIFIMTENHFVAMLFNSVFYACTDWLAFFMLVLVMAISGRKNEKSMKIIKISSIIPLCDSISMLLNCFFNHTYDITWTLLQRDWYYWRLVFYPAHYIHLGLCYIFVLATFVMLIKDLITSPVIYKSRFGVLTSAYAVVIVTNIICYQANLPIDFSIILYAMLAFFVCYYATYLIPRNLVAFSLRNFNLSIDDALICFDLNNQYLYSNPAANKLFDFEGKFDAQAAVKYRASIVERFGNVKEFTSDDEVLMLEDVPVHCCVEYRELKSNGAVIGSYLNFQDRTEEINVLFREHYTATHDQLTGIYNREYFFEMCNKEIMNNPKVPRIMIASNLRDFKTVNELFGNHKGDELLCKEADMLKQFSHRHNIYGRIGDDKFALMMRAEDFVLDVFLQAMKDLGKLIESSTYQVRVSMGIYEFTDSHESASLIYDKALLAMQSMSDDYQQLYAYYDEQIMDHLIIEKQIVADFEKALAENQFEVCLEAMVNSEEKALGAESSVRWRHPEKGVFRPEFFVPVLEKTGYMYKLDLFVWEKVISKLAEWNERKVSEPHYLSINVSETDIFYLNVADEILTLVEKYKVPADRLVVELKESLISSQPEIAMETISELKKAGVQISIDDFGRGISSLKLIEQVDGDVIKIDLSTLREKDEKERTRAVIEFIVSMAKELDMYLIVRGVNSKEEQQWLAALGIEVFQSTEFSSIFTFDQYEKKYLNFAE